MQKRSIRTSSAFTIVELLVVIVVIGTLAAITVVSYTGITSRAAKATLQSDLKNASTQLGMDNVMNGSYPISEAAANGGRGLAKSSGTIYQYSVFNGYYCISATSPTAGSTVYNISSTSGAVATGDCPKFWKQIAAGGWSSCGIASDDLAYCWGDNASGNLGDNNAPNDSAVPVAIYTAGVLNGKTIKSISGGLGHSCAIASDNLAYCWGWNGNPGINGQLGDGSTTNSPVPVAVNISGALSGKTIKSVSAGWFFTCAIASDDKAYCWGPASGGGLLVPGAVDTTGVLSGKTIKSIKTGNQHTCVIASDDYAYCWGRSMYGELGNNANLDSYTVPVSVYTLGALSGKTILSISTGSALSCAIASDYKAYCWGRDWGEAPDASIGQVPVAVDATGVLSGKNLISITSGSNHTCALATDNRIYCWANRSSTPIVVSNAGVLNGKAITYIEAGSGANSTCAFTSDNGTYCWSSWNSAPVAAISPP